MRNLILVAAFACAVPAAASAQSSPTFPDAMDDEIARSLPHPYDVEEAGDRLGGAVGAMLDVPIGGVVQAIDPTARARRNDTIADIAGRGDPDFEARLQDDVRGLTLKTADLMRGLAVAAPVLRRSLADLERNLQGALRGVSDRPYEPDYRD